MLAASGFLLKQVIKGFEPRQEDLYIRYRRFKEEMKRFGFLYAGPGGALLPGFCGKLRHWARAFGSNPCSSYEFARKSFRSQS